MGGPHDKPLAVCLMGPTAAGKTGVAIDLAERGPFEVLSVDSAMVYRGMDIGTAKPGPDVLAAVPHRLIDIRDPAQAYSAGAFRRDALAAINEIVGEGRVPLLVGGTMLYFRALERGLAPLPKADPALRAKLDERGAREGWPVLHAELAEADPDAAAKIHPNDPQRIQRALEVYALTGEPISRLQQLTAHAPVSFLKLAYAPADRADLHTRIGQRFEAMLTEGFVDEVRGLYDRGDLNPRLPSMRSVGYRQLWDHVAGQISLEEAIENALVATRRLAKRQMTWLRSERDLVWFDSANTRISGQTFDFLRTKGGIGAALC